MILVRKLKKVQGFCLDFRYVEELSGKSAKFRYNLAKSSNVIFFISSNVIFFKCDPAALSCAFPFFLFSSPHFLGDRLSMKFQHESAQTFSKIRDENLLKY